MMGEAHRLGHLQMGEAGQNHFDVFFGHVDQCRLQFLEQIDDQVDFAAQPQSHIGGDLVVA
jgi:hypothetical protein